MNVLVLGSGGREHAILWALKRTAQTSFNLFCAPGNGGISEIAECVPISVTEHQALIEYVQSHEIDLTIVGPEAPLAAGIVDEFQRAGLKIVGPRQCRSSTGVEQSVCEGLHAATRNTHCGRRDCQFSQPKQFRQFEADRFGAADAAGRNQGGRTSGREGSDCRRLAH